MSIITLQLSHYIYSATLLKLDLLLERHGRVFKESPGMRGWRDNTMGLILSLSMRVEPVQSFFKFRILLLCQYSKIRM